MMAGFFEAREQGTIRGEACQAKAESKGFDTGAAMRVIIKTLASASGPVSGEDLVDACIRAGHKPHDGRAFGPVFNKLVRNKLIESVGFTTRKKGHGTAGARLWALYDDSVGADAISGAMKMELKKTFTIIDAGQGYQPVVDASKVPKPPPRKR